MRIGIDLDNTIVCYDQAFHRLARERDWIGPAVAIRKEAVRDSLRQQGREEDWITLQGEVYGTRMGEAVLFDGVHRAIEEFLRCGWQVHIVSHRTRVPVAGPPCDLHETARQWLLKHHIVASGGNGIAEECVFLETTRTNKLLRIADLGLDWFIDDLPELLLEPTFPPEVRRVLFDPHRRHAVEGTKLQRLHEWSGAAALLREASP